MPSLQCKVQNLALQGKHSIAEEAGDDGAADRELWAGSCCLQSDSDGGPVHMVHLFC